MGTILATTPGYRTSGYASSTISHGWSGPMASRLDSATSASTWSERRSATVTTALLENALAASGATTSPTSAFFVSTVPSKGARMTVFSSATRAASTAASAAAMPAFTRS